MNNEATTRDGVVLSERERIVLDAARRLQTADCVAIAQKLGWRRAAVQTIVRRLESFGVLAAGGAS